MRECPSCHQPTPDGNFCIRCGAPLAAELDDARRRSEFAAAPAERRYAPWPISSLFPHLPRHSDRHFRAALAAGTLLVIVLGILRLFPVALISAAMLMPLLCVLYFYDVDVYEDQPAWATTWTLAWGAATGVGIGLAARALESSGTSLLDRSSSAQVLLGGILIPAIGVLVILAGPMVLLRYRRFNETLDGASFGAATAASFAAAEAIVVGIGVLSGGLRPPGAAAPWVFRLVGIAIATPVLAMSAVGAAAAAMWLRYRAPVKDRRALGWIGTPVPAVGIAILLVIAGAIGETFMAAGLWLAWVVVLDLVGIVLLRRAVHVGLLEEAAEIDVGDEIRCANCGAMTARHTWCGNCGIALKALPKTGGRWPGSRRLVAAGTALGVVAAVGVAAAALAAPAPQTPRCTQSKPCAGPPILGTARAVFSGYTAWQSAAYGYSLRYPTADWHAASQTPTGVALENGDGISTISFDAARSAQLSPGQLVAQKLSSLGGQMLGLAADTAPTDVLRGTGVGLRSGPGGAYVATTATPQGPNTPVAIAIMAASDGRLSIVVTVTAPSNDPDNKQRIYGQADDIIDSVQWRSP